MLHIKASPVSASSSTPSILIYGVFVTGKPKHEAIVVVAVPCPAGRLAAVLA